MGEMIESYERNMTVERPSLSVIIPCYVVLGSRFLSHGAHRLLYFWHSLGYGFLTFLSNMFSDLNLTDMETCYKVFRRDIL